MGRLVLLLVCTTAVVHAEPRVKTELTLQRGKAKATRLLVRGAEAQELTKCSLGIMLTPQHAEFRSFDLHFAYGAPRTIPIQIDIGLARGSEHVSANGQLTLKPRRVGVDATISAGFDHGAAHWTLRGRISVDDVTCE